MINDYTAVFMTSYKGFPLTQGVIGFKSSLTANQIREDHNKRSRILNNLNEMILNNVEFQVDQTIIFIPELID